ncbi:hypothetical protein [Leptospira santarosai]|nr:hypothetical protein [Leptospira santarosai]EKO77837.1 hypothetical protein LEP1GSC068_1959 [Leptospira sp. Fiocruz LV3954]EMI67532.1 hypothetical protein LEP1GSC076_2173 [Leptospira sp. Fiocruz LV4135]EMJ50895.1 hypothetical protein LEP1GSC169_1581 [Leptospira santarosai str. HAI1349]EMO24173.1 hypothetical protein LEP1GSC168_3299 [Leptospira santarosai str. HAI134]EMO32759.1 hypothetical protein LEP1GSC175_1655 [Leptospira santarosai str. HAI821]
MKRFLRGAFQVLSQFWDRTLYDSANFFPFFPIARNDTRVKLEIGR